MREGATDGREEACTHDGIQSYIRRRRLVLSSRDRPRPRSLSTSFLGVCFVPRPAAFRISQTNKVEKRVQRGGREREPRCPLPSPPRPLGSSFAFPSPVRFAQVSLNRRSGSRAACARVACGRAATSVCYGHRSLQSKRITRKRLCCLRKISHGHRRRCKIR